MSLFTIVVIAIFLIWLWWRRHELLLSWECSGPIAFPLLGNAYILFNMDENMRKLDEMCLKYASPIRFWAGPLLFLIIHDVEDVQTILKSPDCLNRMYNYRFLNEVVSDTVDGLFTSNGAEWKLHRRFVAKSFGANSMYNNLPIVGKHMRKLLTTLKGEIGKKAFDIRLKINRGTVDLFLESTLGFDFPLADKMKMSDYLVRGQKIISKRIFMPWFQIDFIWKLSGYPKELKQFTSFRNKLIDDIIASKINDKCGDLSFIDRLLVISDENEDFSLEDVKVETTTLIMGASDTTAVSIANAVLLLAMHPDCQERCYEELKRILPNRDTEVTSEHLHEMHYTERCIKEALRLFPTVSLIARSNTKNIKLKNITVPPGQSIIVALRQLMRKKEHWGDDAEEFNPDHFLPERLAKIPSYAFIPFSDGPRVCVALQYAMVVLKTMVVYLFRNYRYSTSLKMGDIKIRSDVNSRLLNNHMVTVHYRHDDE